MKTYSCKFFFTKLLKKHFKAINETANGFCDKENCTGEEYKVSKSQEVTGNDMSRIHQTA